ncbi:hypothetical protein D3C77_479080 [compost metagenome]
MICCRTASLSLIAAGHFGSLTLRELRSFNRYPITFPAPSTISLQPVSGSGSPLASLQYVISNFPHFSITDFHVYSAGSDACLATKASAAASASAIKPGFAVSSVSAAALSMLSAVSSPLPRSSEISILSSPCLRSSQIKQRSCSFPWGILSSITSR